MGQNTFENGKEGTNAHQQGRAWAALTLASST
jgi:hypothetical protein